MERGATAPRLVLEIDVGERPAIVIADNEAGVGFLDGPRRREAAGCHPWHYTSHFSLPRKEGTPRAISDIV
jgi:hypothetical protein